MWKDLFLVVWEGLRQFLFIYECKNSSDNCKWQFGSVEMKASTYRINTHVAVLRLT